MKRIKAGCSSITFHDNPTALLNELKRRVANRKHIVTYADDYDMPKKQTRFAVIQIKRWGHEYRGVINIVQVL